MPESVDMPAPVSATQVRPRSSSTSSTRRTYRADQRARIHVPDDSPVEPGTSAAARAGGRGRAHSRIELSRQPRRALADELPETVAAACHGFMHGPLAEN